MNKVNWAQVAVFGVVALLVLLLGLSFLSFGWGGGGMMGPGMMGGWGGMPGLSPVEGMGGWPGSVGGSWGGALGWFFALIGLLIPLGLLALLILGGVWLFRQVGGTQGPAGQLLRPTSDKTCPSCGRTVQTDWQVCPYCGQGLV